MLKITRIDDRNPAVVTLQLEGKIASEWVPLLEAECLRYLRATRTVRLDLSAVTFADDNGLELLRQLTKKPVAIINPCGLIRDSLKSRISGKRVVS